MEVLSKRNPCLRCLTALMCILLLGNSLWQSNAQTLTKTVSGVVVDHSGEPLAGTSVMVKGTRQGTTTDLDGKFNLSAPDGAVIVFQFLGFKDLEMEASSIKEGMTITLVEDSEFMEEVIIVGYGTQRKMTMTGSVSQIKADAILQSPEANLGAALAGRATGLTTYQYSGQPGDDDVILRIRGNGTLDGSANSAEPLILVDGVERSFFQIDPNEIENLTILKDAASTAVYGIRGANGVILVTTKQGVEGRPRVSFSSNFALQSPLRQQTNLDAVTYARRYNQGWMNDGHDSPYFSEEDLDLFASGADPYEHGSMDWKKELIKRVADQQQYNLNVSGGNSQVKYYVSLGYLNQGGLIKDFKGKVEGHDISSDFYYKRLNFRNNIEVNATNTTKIVVQFGGIIGNQQSTTSVAKLFQDIVYAAPMSGLFLYDNKLLNPSRYPDSEHRISPLKSLLADIAERRNNVINTNLRLEQDLGFLLKGLKTRMMASYDSEYTQKNTTVNPNANVFYSITQIDPLVLEQDGEYGILATPTSSYSRRQQMHAEAALEYKNSFGKNNLGILFLGTLDKKWWHGKEYPTIPISYMGLVGRLTYDYGHRYMFELNMGYNGSENFPKDKRFALFPAVSVGWNLTEEPFMKSVVQNGALSKVKFRGSYGLVGNDAAGAARFMYLTSSYNTSGAGSTIYLGSSTQKTYSGYLEGKLGNPNVTWETSAKQNYGIDLGFFKNELTLTAELFHEDRKDILTTLATNPIHMAIQGQDVYNIGRVKNHGFEVEAEYRHTIPRSKNTSFWIGGAYSFARNKVIEDGSIQDPDNPQLWTRNRSTGLSWIYVADGFYSTQEEILQGPVPATNLTLGDVRMVDINGDGIIDGKDTRPTMYPEIPEIIYSSKWGFSTHGFSLNVLFQGGAHSTKLVTEWFKRFNLNYPEHEAWTPETKDVATRPRVSVNNSNSYNLANSTLWTRDGSYLKLRNVELSYVFPKNLLKKMKIDVLRVYVNGQNLYSWDHMIYVDPEMRTNGASGNYGYPQLRVFNLGANISF